MKACGDEGEGASTPVSKPFKNLSSVIRGLRGMPLNITAIKCLSAYYRGTKPYPQNPRKVFNDGECENALKHTGVMLVKPKRGSPAFHPSIKVLLIAERNKSWADDANVVARVKTAFYNELALLLKKVRSRWLALSTESRLVVVLGQTVFSIKLAMQNELDAAAKSSRVDFPLTPSSVNRRILTKMCLSQQLLSLARKYPSFACSCQMVRRWLGSNFLSSTLDGMAMELMVAHAFVSPDISTPLTEAAGLFAFLRLLSTHDFVSQPVIVDIDRKLSAEKLALLKTDFARRRPTFPLLTLLIPEDTRGEIFTHCKPEPVLLKRLVQLASSAYTLFAPHSTQPKTSSTIPEGLFQHSLSIYDIIIRLRGKHVVSGNRQRPQKKRRKRKHGVTIMTQSDDVKTFLPVIDYNPQKCFLKELKHNYGSAAIFFHSENDFHAIGVMLRPGRPVYVKVGVPSLVEDFKILGRGLVRDIIVKEGILRK